MTRRTASNKIKRRKALINFLLNYLSPGNRIIVMLSQDLDKHIVKYQRYLSYKYKKAQKEKRRFVRNRRKIA